MAAKQLIDDKTIQNEVIKELKIYKALKVKMENKKEQEEEGIDNLFPVLIKSDQIDRENILKVRQIDRALQNSLDVIEKKIIEAKYLHPTERKDIEIYLSLRLKKDKFYEKKRNAINSLATALGII
ncbi:ArpU family transcriptional regulator [Anaerobacillus alkalilacustris]|uniref:ArpU family transcriptional regulator n=1 Tax=Anaerobacillus alkalilacustris TaxID=393763 RepID=A0A1S2LJI1_9BACI|nr:ArpU family phage packaging/lysis transcriptional regulator [Anaerobacillus alkalilacustris]OIJ12672.1 ArpU family transcriptional regulator [Anaerobacillus alkalilacustris]